MLIWFFVGLPASWWVRFLCSLSWTVLTVAAVLFGLVAINKDKATKEIPQGLVKAYKDWAGLVFIIFTLRVL
jgi:hypothetical protein